VDLAARRTIAALPALVRYLRRERPAVLLSTLEHSNILAVCAGWLSLAGTRIVLREANVFLPRDQIRGLKPRVQRSLLRLFYRGSVQVIAVAKGVEESLIRDLGLLMPLVRTITTQLSGWTLDRLAAAPLDAPWFEPGAPPVVLGVGRLVPQKDFASLLRAFAIVRAGRPARLVILGGGPSELPWRLWGGNWALNKTCAFGGKTRGTTATPTRDDDLGRGADHHGFDLDRRPQSHPSRSVATVTRRPGARDQDVSRPDHRRNRRPPHHVCLSEWVPG